MPLFGVAMTGDIRMRCMTREFTENPASIPFHFSGKGLVPGDTVKGEFKLISNQGEYTLPYHVTIVPELFETSLGQIKNLFHFANLARISWQEAVKVFYSSAFEEILTGNDRQYLNLYRALCVPRKRNSGWRNFSSAYGKNRK